MKEPPEEGDICTDPGCADLPVIVQELGSLGSSTNKPEGQQKQSQVAKKEGGMANQPCLHRTASKGQHQIAWLVTK